MPQVSDLIAGGKGLAKALASRIPVFSEIFATFDSYRKARFERETKEFLNYLETALAQVGEKFDPSWFASPDGEKYARKVFDCGVDAQLAEKKELFAKALLSGAIVEEIDLYEKLKFIDILRQLSRAALNVLADMHEFLAPDARGPGRTPSTNKPYPLVDPKRIAERLSSKYHPYLIEASLYEMQGQGLFSNIGEWTRQADGSSRPGGGFAEELAYTDFTCRFVEFITLRKKTQRGENEETTNK